MSSRLNCAVFALAACIAGPAAADLVTSVPVGYDTKVITFSGYQAPEDAVFKNWTDGDAAIDVGTAEAGLGEKVLLSFTASSTGYALGTPTQTFGGNGSWPGPMGAYAGMNKIDGGMMFMFERDLDFVGGFVNVGDGDINSTVMALDADGNTIQELNFKLDFQQPTGLGLGSFFGFERSGGTAIRGLMLLSNYASIDNLTFGTLQSTGTGVPEPGSTGLVLASLGALVLARRKTTR